MSPASIIATIGDPARFVQTLNNISNHYSAYGADPFALQLVIVAHSRGDQVLSEYARRHALEATRSCPPKTFERVEDLAKNGLKVHLCEITFSRLKIDKAKVHATRRSSASSPPVWPPSPHCSRRASPT